MALPGLGVSVVGCGVGVVVAGCGVGVVAAGCGVGVVGAGCGEWSIVGGGGVNLTNCWSIQPRSPPIVCIHNHLPEIS